MVEFEPYKDRYEVNYSLDKGKTYITEKVVEDPEEARSIGTRLRAEGKRYITIQQTLAEGGTLTDFKFKTDWELRAAIGTHIKLVMPDGTKRNAAFAIAELDSIISSHNEYTFSPSDNFPVDKNGQNINDRNYQDDKNAQAKVIDMAINVRPEDIVTDSRKVSGTPIVSADGIVVSGNNRTMSLKRVKNDNPERYEEYVTEIEDRAINYGFEKIERSQDGSLLVVDSEGKSFEFKKPVLVRIDFDFPEYNTLEMSKYNQATGKAERPVDVAIKLGKILNSNNECKEAVINIISNYETFSELYSNTADQKALSNIFIKYGILTTQAMPMYFGDNRFTDAGKDLIENMLAGLILEKDSLILSSEGRIKNYKQIIITSLPVLVKNASLGDDYSIIPELNKAIIIENKIGNLSFKDYLAQMDMFEQLPEKNVLLLNRLLSLGRNKFKASIEGYNNSAESNKEGDMFGETLTKQQIFDGHITNKIDADDVKLIDSALSNQSKLSVPEKEIKTEPIAMEKENTVVNAIDQNPFVGGNYFAQNPDKILAQVVTGKKSRWGKDIVEYKGTLDDIARIDAPENFIGANKENEPIATVINTPIKDVTDKDIDVLDSFKEALEKNKDSVTKKTTKKAKKALPTAIIDEVAGESTTLKEAFETLNPEISLEELRAFIWYKEKTGRPILNQDWINLSEPQADSRSTNEKIKDWVEAGILYYFDGELIPSFLYLSGNIYDKQNRLIAVENINDEDVEEMDSAEDDEEKEMEPTPKVSRSDSGADKDIIIERYGIDVYNRQVEALMNVFSTKYANRLVIKGGENTDGALVVLPNSKLAKNFKIKHTNTMPEFKWKQITAASHKNYGRPDFLNRPALMRDYHVFPELSLRDAFCLWLASGDVSVKSGINYADIIKIYIDGKNKPASSAQPDEEGRYVGAQLKVKQEEDATWERLKAKTKAEGDRLFNIFLDTELEMNDRVRLETTWNRQFNAIVNVNYNKVPVAFRSRRGEAVRPEKREAVAFTFASGSGLLAYDVGVGKASLLKSDILTPTGYKKMGDIKLGDYVVGKNGKPTKVVGVFPQGIRESYRVTFSDGSFTEVTDEHLWNVQTINYRSKYKENWKTVRTMDIKDSLFNYRGDYQYSIPMVEPVQFEATELPIHPYLLGVILGDGGISCGSVHITNTEADIMAKVKKLIPESTKLVKKINTEIQYSIIRRENAGSNELIEKLRDLGLMGKKSATKFIPKQYLFNTTENRLELLRGLIDTDGYIGKDSHKNGCNVTFTTVSEGLKEGVKFLVQSFGGTVIVKTKTPHYTHNGERRTGQLAYTISIRLPHDIVPVSSVKMLKKFIPKTKYQPIRFIQSIENIGFHEAQCIKVDAEDSLYVVEEFIVTHNTPSAVFTTSQFLDTGYAKRPLIIVPNQTYKQWFGEFKTFAPHIKLNGLYNLSDNYLDEVRDVNGKVQPVEEGTVTIITYEGLKQIGFNEETEVFLKNEVGEILMQVDRGEEKSNKKRDREFEKLNSQVEKLIGSALAKTKVNIEDLGFDFICMDEAHAAKKVFTAVKGEKEENLGNSEKETKARSQYQISSGVPSFTGIKSFMLTQYIQKHSGGGNTLLLTATPFTNSPLEIYSMLSMVGFHKLKSMGLNNLTTFFDTYVGISYELIINSRLRPERRQVIMGFNNLLSLQSLIRNFINYKTGEEVNVQRPNKIVIPLKSKIVDGVRISLPDEEQVNATIELSPLQKDLMDRVKSYADGKIDESALCTLNFDFDEENEDAAKAEGVELSEDSLSKDEKTGVRLLKAMNHSRNLALSPYIFECSGLGTPTYKEYVETSNKLTYVIESIRTIKEYHEKEGTAMSGVVIYMDRGVHFFPLLREYLIREAGFEEHEVGIISSKLITPTPKGLPKDEAKEHVKNLFLGKIFNPTTMELETLPEEQRMKIVIGSSTIKEGINLQAHSSALFNCWLDWNPTDIQQLEGRIYRQGNKFKNVRIVNPLMIDSMDIFMFQKLEEKTSRINTIWESDGRTNVLKTEDFNPKELKMALIKDPAVLAELETIDDVDAIDNEIADIKNLIKRENKIIHSVNTIVNYAENLHDFIEQYRPGKSKIDVNAKEFAPELIKNHLALAREIFTKQLDDEGKKIEAKWSRNPKKEAEGYYSNKHSYPPSKQYWFDELNLANLTLIRETNSYLVPSKLRVMDLPSHIKFLEEKVKEVESSKEKLTSEEALKIKTEYIIQQRLEKNIVEKPVFKLVDEFKRLNYLLSEVKPNLSANKQPNGPLLDEKGLARIDKEALEHLENIAKNEPDTKLLHTVEVIDADGNKQLVYTPERIKLHDEIIKDLTKDAVCISNDTPIAVLTGGAPGSGKSSFLKKYGEYLTSDKIFHIDADLVRERIPEYKGWNASATHQESRDVVNELIDTFDKPCKHDLLYDGTMSNAKKYIPLIKRIKGLGYKVFIVFMDIPKEVSVERALGRFQRGGAKGRYVPAEVIEDFYSTGKKGLDEIKNAVDGYMVVDSLTSNIIERGGIEMPRDRKYSAVFNGESGALPAEQIKVDKPTVEQLKARVMTIKKMIAKNPTPVLKARLKIVEKMLLTPEKFCCGGSINPYHGQEFKKGGPVEKSKGKFQLVVYAKDGSVRNAIVFKTKEAAEENAKTYTKMGLKYDIYPYELVYTKDGVPVNRRSNEHKDHVFYHEDGTKYKCLGYSEKLDDCVFQTIPEGTKVVGCVKGFYYNDPTKPKKFRDGGYVPEGEHANIYNNLIGERERVEFLSGNFREYSDSELSDMASLGYNSLPKKVKEVVAKWIDNRHNSSLLQPYPEETYSLWNEYWTEGARKHFITDHFKGKKRSEYLKLINEPYSDLPSDLKLTIEKHRVEPKYANGGLFEAKQRYADNRNKQNSKITTLTEEQHSALSNLARVRHEFHSQIDRMVKNSDVFGKNETNLIIANIELQKSGLKKIPFIPIVDEIDIGYTSIDDNISALDVLIETGEGLDGEEMPNEEENEVAYREWYEDNYHKIYEALDVWNEKIETYLKNIDKDHGTTYAPTGHARLKYAKGGYVRTNAFDKNEYNANFDHDEKVRKMFSDMGFNDVKIKTVLTNGLSQYVSLKAKVLDEKKLYRDIFVYEDYPINLVVRVSDHFSNLERISGGVSGNTLSFEAFKKLVDNNIIEPIYRQGGSVDQKKVAKVMHEFKEHELKTHGKVVTNPKQAIAIALSEARKSE